jgi:hypothetical protein
MSGLFPLSELVQGEPDLLKLDQKFSRPASDAQIEKTKKSLEAKSHKVTVVNTASEAVALLKSQIPEGATVYNAGSTTLVSPLSIRLLRYYFLNTAIERDRLPRRAQDRNKMEELAR